MSRLLRLLCFALAVWVTSATHRLYQLRVTDDQRVVVSEVKTSNPKKYYRTVDDDQVIVAAVHEARYNETGWDFFDVKTNGFFADEVQAYYAGYLEGTVTHDLIYMHWYNNLGNMCVDDQDLCEELNRFVEKNMDWVRDNIRKYSNNSDYWHQVHLYYRQIEGIADGYINENGDESTQLTRRDIMMMNNPDLDDIMQMLKAKKSNFTHSNPLEGPKVTGNLPCSALIKVLPDGSEIFAAQDTWSAYGTMLRMQKKYNFSYHMVGDGSRIVPGRAMTFSSYPGVVTSGDDFYVISSGLVTMETTIGNSNSSLWRYVKPEGQVSEGARSMVANRLSRGGKIWSEIFAGYNSGTYNNQWMVLDYKKFNPGTKPENLPDDLLWVSEQIPGYIRYEDKTSVLRAQGYWPSYNTAYFKDVFVMSGNEELVEKYGDWFTYDKNPRALIFKRDHEKVHDLDSMLLLMRYNDFKNDPLSRCNCTPPYSAENAISARNDLNPADGTYPFPALGHRSHGATDAKITSKELYVRGLQFLSVSGPIYNESRGIPPFQWSATDFGTSARHLGHPDLWKFEPLIYKWIQN